MAGFDKYLKAVLERAGDEARQDRSTTVEAQHLLLAIVDPGTPLAGTLNSAGVNRAAIRTALDREFSDSLRAAGVSASAFDVPPATPDPHRQPQPGASIHLTLERATKAAAGAQLRPEHLLIGILRAEVGTVPRALALAGVDRAALLASIQETLSTGAKR